MSDSDTTIRAGGKDDEQERRAREIEETVRAADAKRKDDEEAEAGKSLDKTLTAIGDGLKACTDALTAIGKRMDDLEKRDGDTAKAKDDAAAIRKRVDHVAQELAAKELAAHAAENGGDDFDELGEAEQAQMVEQELGAMEPEEREGEGARRKAADSARRRYDEAIKRESRFDRDRRHEGFRATAWGRADDVFNALGMTAPKPMPSEPPRSYRRRLLRQIQRHSPAYKEINLAAINDARVFKIAEETIYSDALREARAPTDIAPGRLRMVEKRTDSGATVRTFHGEPRSWMDPIAGMVQLRCTGSFRVPGSTG